MFMSCSSTASTVNNPEPHLLLEHQGGDVLHDQQQSINIHYRYKYVCAIWF